MNDIDQKFFTEWAAAPDALPLVLVGGEKATQAALATLRAAFTSADIYEVKPSGKTIAIADIRALQATANQRAWSGNRLVVIPHAETLSVPAAQALLKTLEEPTRTTRFVLTTRWWRRLLPTIRSRCIRVPVGKSVIAESFGKPVELPASLLARFAAYSGDTPLSPEMLEHITALLEKQLRKEGPTPALKVAYMRLRDYHRITAEPGANQKLARDVLLASLPPTV